MTTLEELGLEGEGRPADDKAMEAFINHMTGKVAPPPEDARLQKRLVRSKHERRQRDEETAANMETDDDENVPDSPRLVERAFFTTSRHCSSLQPSKSTQKPPQNDKQEASELKPLVSAHFGKIKKKKKKILSIYAY